MRIGFFRGAFGFGRSELLHQEPIYPFAREQVRKGYDPHDTDHSEADDEGGVAGPLLGQPLGERTALLVHADLDDQQRDGDSENTIGEGLESAGIRLASHGTHIILPEHETILPTTVLERFL